MRLFNVKDPFEFLYEDDQERVAAGEKAQKDAARDFERRVPGSQCTFISPPHSKKTDITLSMTDGEIKIECKLAGAKITVYDAMLQRNSREPFLDWFASRLIINPNKLSFAQLMDRVRRKDRTVGFVGDKGITGLNTGKVPAWWIASPQVLEKLRSRLIQKYAERGDNYFALVTRQGQVQYYYISGPVIPELNAKPFPKVLRAKTDTYGKAATGYVRPAIKVFLQP